MSPEEIRARYQRAAHAMQTGVKMLMEIEGPSRETSPKHLRVGVNSALSDMGALARLLIQKGVISAAEYELTVMLGMEMEVRSYEAKISALTGGAKITLA